MHMLLTNNTSIFPPLRQLKSNHMPCLHKRNSQITDNATCLFVVVKKKKKKPICKANPKQPISLLKNSIILS